MQSREKFVLTATIFTVRVKLLTALGVNVVEPGEGNRITLPGLGIKIKMQKNAKK